MRFIILGAPGAGKGTQASSVSSKYNVPHISTGDIFRQNIKDGTELGKKAKQCMDKGELVPDSLTCDLLFDRIQKEDAKDGFLLDGFPRNIYQAEKLDEYLKKTGQKLDLAINVVVDEDILVDRTTGRRVCKNCGATYHVRYNKPKVDGICDECGLKLVQRDDDKEDTVKNRIKVYNENTKPLIAYYENRNIIADIDGQQDIDKVLADIVKAIESVKE